MLWLIGMGVEGHLVGYNVTYSSKSLLLLLYMPDSGQEILRFHDLYPCVWVPQLLNQWSGCSWISPSFCTCLRPSEISQYPWRLRSNYVGLYGCDIWRLVLGEKTGLKMNVGHVHQRKLSKCNSNPIGPVYSCYTWNWCRTLVSLLQMVHRKVS